MTVICSIATSSFAVVAADSALTLTFPDEIRRQRRRKLTVIHPTYVACWGELVGDPLALWLQSLPIDVTECADCLSDALREHLATTDRPGDHGIGHLGYHVGGLDVDGRVRLFNVAWEPPNTQPFTPVAGQYIRYDHTPGSGANILFNGRHDVATHAVNALVAEIKSGKETRFALGTPEGALRFADFVTRFVAELSPDVGPPFLLAAVSDQRSLFRYTHRRLGPLPQTFERQVARALKVAG